jgi:hypothetical protein
MSDAAPPTALLDLARKSTRGDVSPRRHQASRALVVDRLGQRRSRAWTAFAVVGLVMGGGAATFAGFKSLRGLSPPQANEMSISIANSAPGAVPSIDTDLPAPSPPSGVKIAVQPDNAVVYWDDKKLDDNPASFDFKADHKPHRIRAEAPGYASKTQIVTMDSEAVAMNLELKPIPATMGPLTVSASIIDADTIIEGQRDAFQSCYLDALPTAPTMAGKLTLVVRVKADGEVENVDVLDKEGLSAKVTTCLQAAVADARFQTNDLAGTVRVPFVFRAK